jgi:hypothetical protein
MPLTSRLSLFILLSALLALPALRANADDFLPNVDPGKVVVRTIPGYPAIEAEIEGNVEKEWDRGFRQCARYVASINNELRWPVVVVYPDWVAQPPEPKARMLVHLILNEQKDFALPKEKGLAMTDQPQQTVVCYSQYGAFTLENFKKGLAEVQNYMKKNNLVQSGPPRILYFTNPAWIPRWWMLSEIQIPIPNVTNSPSESAPAAQ